MIRKLFITLLIIAIIPLVYSQEYKFYALSNDGSNTEPVYLCKLDGVTGAISVIERFAGVVQGNYFALSNDNKSLLVTSKNKSNDEGGLVQYSINDDGSLVYVSEQLKPGDLPCHVSVTPDSAYVLSANYADDEISLYTFTENELSEEIDHINKADQSKGHYISTDPSGQFIHAVFLGQNKVFNYKIENNAFVENPDQASFSVPDGYGPRHMAFHPEKDFVYILNETHSSVTSCSYDSQTGALSEIQNISMLPDGYTGTSYAAAIKIHPNGNYLYASNRGHNSIAVYEITTEGSLDFIEHETTGINFPRDFGISPDGKYMIIANQKGTSVISLEIDESTGKLTNTGKFIAIQKPLAIKFLPTYSSPPITSAQPDISSKDMFTVFPNPARDQIQVTFSGSSSNTAIELYNIKGQRVDQILPGQTGHIDVSALPGGIYIVKGRTLNSNMNKTIILN